MVARRRWTRQWWDEERRHYELVTSPVAIEELEEGTGLNEMPHCN